MWLSWETSKRKPGYNQTALHANSTYESILKCGEGEVQKNHIPGTYTKWGTKYKINVHSLVVLSYGFAQCH